VPRFCSAKSPSRITQLNGTTLRDQLGSATLSPSAALNTEIAGVMTPSPYSSAAPIKANSATKEILPGLVRILREPPQRETCRLPLLWAFMMKVKYLTVTTIVSAQMVGDKMLCVGFRPMPVSRVQALLQRVGGLVPMSPNTTPRRTHG
jgi:hypothetical protein